MADIANRSPGEGMEAIRTAMNELQSYGYLDKFRVKSVATGKWAGWEYVIRETPNPPTLDKPMSDKPMSDLPMSVNPVCLENTVSLTKLSFNKNVTGTPEPANPIEIEVNKLPCPSLPLRATGGRTHVSSALNCIDRDFVEKEWESQGYRTPLSPNWKYKDLPPVFKAHLENL